MCVGVRNKICRLEVISERIQRTNLPQAHMYGKPEELKSSTIKGQSLTLKDAEPFDL